MEERIIETAHGRVAAVDYGGAGPEVVLLHGGGCNLAHWNPSLGFMPGRRFVAFDFRYHGLSSDTGDLGLDACADDVDTVVRQLGLDNPSVVGHSLGGMVAAAYGERHPDCPGVANVDGHGQKFELRHYVGVAPEEVEADAREAAQQSRRMAQEVRHGDSAWHEARVAAQIEGARTAGFALTSTDPFVTRDFVQAADGSWHGRPSPKLFEQLDAVVPHLDLFSLYRRVHCPLLICLCTRGRATSNPRADAVHHGLLKGIARELAAIASERPNVTVQKIDSGHMVVLERPRKLAVTLMRWWDQRQP